MTSMNFMQNFNMNQYSRLDAKKQRRIEHTNKRHPAIANGIWLSRELSNKNDCDGDTFEKTSPIFHGYNITRRLQKKGPSIPAMGREILEKLMFKETGQTKDVYVKVPPYGAGKFVEGRVWDRSFNEKPMYNKCFVNKVDCKTPPKTARFRAYRI